MVDSGVLFELGRHVADRQRGLSRLRWYWRLWFKLRARTAISPNGDKDAASWAYPLADCFQKLYGYWLVMLQVLALNVDI